MLLIPCPYCEEERPELEFRYAGEAHIVRPPRSPSSSTTRRWRTSSIIRTNPKGLISERWRHIHGCARFFNCVRDTVSDRIVTTYKAGEPKPDLSKRGESGPAAWANRPPDQLNVKEPGAARGARMTARFRIAGAGRLTPAKTVRFTFDGKCYAGLAGDTLASALLANGVHLVGRSFKYHRPRGILSAGAEEPNALVDSRSRAARETPNLRATVRSSMTA